MTFSRQTYYLLLHALCSIFSALCLIICQPIPAFSLDPKISIRQYGIDIWDANKGFPYFAIHSMIQTKDGYIWLATDEGAVRFDGVQFTLYDSSNTKAIRNNNISSFVENTNGELWIGTRGGGICTYKNGTFKIKSLTDGLPGLNVNALCLDHTGTIWVGIESFGFAKWQNEKFSILAEKNQPNVGQFYVIYEFRNGELGYGVGGYQLKDATSERIKLFPGRTGYVKGIVEDFIGRRWVGTDLGLYFQTQDSLIPVKYHGAPTSRPITVIFEDSDHNIWIGTEGNGLFRYANGEFSSITIEDGLASNRILSIMEDSEKNLWVGTRGGGLTRLKNQSIVTFTKQNGLTGDYITALYECRDSTIFVASKESQLDEIKNGIVLFSYKFDVVNTANHIRGLYEGSDGTIWVGTQHGTFLLKKTSSGTRRKISEAHVPEYLRHEEVKVFFTKSDGTFYLGSYGRGLWKYEDKTYSSIKLHDSISLKGSYHRAIKEDKSRNLWLATQHGVIVLKKDTMINYNSKNGLTNNQVFALYIDSNNSVWIGTYGGGLCRIKDRSIKHFLKKDGLFDDVIYSILEDGNGNFWMSCNKGIFSVSKQQLNEFAEGKISSFNCTSYGITEGMKSVECNGGSQFSAIKLHDGTMLFATVKGVVKIDPQNLQSNTAIPPVVIENITIDGQLYKNTDTISTQAGVREIEIQYTALSFVVPEKVSFRYTLEGFDNHWNNVGTRRKAYYTNLQPGSYKFKVIACNNVGVWNYTGASILIKIPPFLWETWWFRTGLGILVLGTILFLFKQRERTITQREQQKREIQKQLTDLESRALRAQMNPHFIFNALNSIQECILTNKTEAACEYLSKFAQLLRITLESSEKTYIPLDKEIQVLQLYLELESLRFDNEFEYTLQVDPELENATFTIPAMMIQPYVENSIWHGLLHKHDNRKLTISLHLENEMLLCIVEDNGIGRERASEIRHAMKKDYESKGMRVTRERLEMMRKGSGVNASVNVIDLYDTEHNPLGTRVEILIPIQQL